MMTQSQLHLAVAQATGETIALIRTLGFGLVTEAPDDLEPEDLGLVAACPHCRCQVPYPGMTRDGALVMAECVQCDVYFHVPPEKVAVASVACA
jgi:hypothetical protein